MLTLLLRETTCSFREIRTSLVYLVVDGEIVQTRRVLTAERTFLPGFAKALYLTHTAEVGLGHAIFLPSMLPARTKNSK